MQCHWLISGLACIIVLCIPCSLYTKNWWIKLYVPESMPKSWSFIGFRVGNVPNARWRRLATTQRQIQENGDKLTYALTANTCKMVTKQINMPFFVWIQYFGWYLLILAKEPPAYCKCFSCVTIFTSINAFVFHGAKLRFEHLNLKCMSYSPSPVCMARHVLSSDLAGKIIAFLGYPRKQVRLLAPPIALWAELAT